MKWVLVGLGILLFGLCASYVWAGRELKPLDETERARAPGQFAELPDGKIHYRLSGPEGAPLIVAVEAPQVHQLVQLTGVADEIAGQVLREATGFERRPAQRRIQPRDFGHLADRDVVDALLVDRAHVSYRC